MASRPARPVQLLRAQARELEATITVCLADPKEKAVHKLRSGGRRIEAQLALLRRLKDLPPFRTEARELERELRKLRRAAGDVRDMDVHITRLEDLKQNPPSASEEARKLRDEAHQLADDLAAHRERRAHKLLALLEKRQTKVAAATEALLKALKPAAARAVGPAELLELAEQEFQRAQRQTSFDRYVRRLRKATRNGSAAAHAATPSAGDPSHHVRGTDTDDAGGANGPKRPQPRISDDDLHLLRKAAKKVRYMAEGAEASRSAKTTAKEFEALQESGGVWHDWLALTEEARALLGRKHVLTRELKQRARQHRASFLHALERRTL